MSRLLSTLLLLSALAAVAAAQTCVSEVCTTGGMGNVDCCKHDYAAKAKCWWPNTPVSYTAAGTCVLDGKTHAVITRNNFQGPPDNSTPCRCPNPLVAPSSSPSPSPSPPAPQAPPQYRVVSGYDIPGKDIPSPDGRQPFTRICTPSGGAGYKGKYGYDAYALMCRDTKGCVAITTERSSPSGCAYMKAAGDKADMKASADWVVVTSKLPPQQPCKFAALGEKCTSDPFVDQPICCGGNRNPCVNGVCVSGFPSSSG